MIGPVLRSLARDRRGAGAVEFALIAVPLFLILFGTIEYGRLQWTRSALVSVANAGARCAGVVQSQCAASGAYSAAHAQAFVIETAAALSVPLTDANVTLNRAATCGGVANFSKVTITFAFSTPLPFLFGSLQGGVPMVAEACFPNQTPAA